MAMNEQEATDKLEELVGSVEKCFRLMRLYRTCKQEKLFRKRAKEEGYSTKAINHYLNYIR